MALQIRRGTDTQRQALSGPNTPIAGELLYNTDNKKLYIGDGTTTGGTSIGYFGSVAVSGQGTLRSTGINEALTIVAGANISLTTDANTGTLTIAAAPQELNNGSLRLFQNNISSINSNENINIAPAGTGQVNITSSLIVTGGVATSLIRTTESKITLGLEAGQTSQGNFTVAVGYGAGKTSQGQNSVAIGVDSGKISQLYDSIAVGYGAGFRNQGNYAVALGASAGRVGQGEAAVAIGGGAGGTGDVNGLTGGQGAFAVAIGFNSALGDQGSYAVAIGASAGNGQGVNAVAIGVQAGAGQQGANSVAIGSYAGQTSQPARTTIINSSGSPVNGVAAQTDSFYVAPIRSATGTSGVLQYNSTTKEVSYNNTVSVSSVTSTSVTSTSVTSGSLNVTGIFSNQNISIDENRIRSLNSNQSIFLDPAGTGVVNISSNLLSSGIQIFGPAGGGASGDGTILVITQSPTAFPLNILEIHSTGSTVSGGVNLGRARGSLGVQTAVQNNDTINQFLFTGYDGTAYQPSSAITASVAGAVSSNVVPGKLDLSTSDASGNLISRLSVSSTAVTSTVPVKLAVYANGTARDAAITSPTAGMIVFNTTGTKFQGYTGSTWVDLN